MTSRHLVDPELLPMLEQSARTPLICTTETLAAIRQQLPKMIQRPADPEADAAVGVEDIRIPGPTGAPPVRVLVYTPKSAKGLLPAVLHIHGGGYVMGIAEMSEVQCKQFAHKLGCLVVSVDYRLPPETPHPGPVEDCYAALTWLVSMAKERAVDPTRIAITGESAGGGLAAALALLSRDRKEIQVAFQLLTYPMIDDRTSVRKNVSPFIGEFAWTAPNNHFGWECLLGRSPGGDGVPIYAAAARATDLSGLPPAYIAVGALDLFVEENLDYARRLILAGVPTELHVYPGAFHGFPGVTDASVSKAFERDRLNALVKALRN